jgi:SAM-dependent methyltransferase
MMTDYYGEKLHGNRLKRCYEIAPPRIQQYLKAEILYVLDRTPLDCRVLELGCGYGRVMQHLLNRRRSVYGIDTSRNNIELAAQNLGGADHHLCVMNAVRLGFKDNAFDRVICIQNGISAFHVDQQALMLESIRVAKNHGIVFYSSYSDKIWRERLEWFELQARAGLLGEIDWHKTRDGVIVCRNGFTASTLGPDRLRELTVDLPVDVTIEEIDESSIFCVLTARKEP